MWIFAPKLVKNCHFMIAFWVILGQNHDFWPKSSNIWYILVLESKNSRTILNFSTKIQIVRWFPRFLQNSISEQKYDFWHSVASSYCKVRTLKQETFVKLTKSGVEVTFWHFCHVIFM